MLGISQAHRILKLPGIFPISVPDVLQSLFDCHVFASWTGSDVYLIEQREQLGGIAWVWNSVVIDLTPIFVALALQNPSAHLCMILLLVDKLIPDIVQESQNEGVFWTSVKQVGIL